MRTKPGSCMRCNIDSSWPMGSDRIGRGLSHSNQSINAKFRRRSICNEWSSGIRIQGDPEFDSGALQVTFDGRRPEFIDRILIDSLPSMRRQSVSVTRLHTSLGCIVSDPRRNIPDFYVRGALMLHTRIIALHPDGRRDAHARFTRVRIHEQTCIFAGFESFD